jgi:hypothetical protein
MFGNGVMIGMISLSEPKKWCEGDRGGPENPPVC